MLRRWTALVIRHRGLVVASWLAVLLLGSLSSLGLSSLLSTSLSVPGSDSARADAILVNKFHQNIEGTFTVVLPFGTASNAQIAHFEAAIARAARSIPTGTVTEQKALAGILYARTDSTTRWSPDHPRSSTTSRPCWRATCVAARRSPS